MTELRVVDADGHVNEPEDLWATYLPAAFLDRAPGSVRDDAGPPAQRHRRARCSSRSRWLRRGARPGRPTGGWDPQARLADLDAEGIDQAVLFPTTGLFFAGIADAKLESALCQAYNDWLPTTAPPIAVDSWGSPRSRRHDVDAAVAEARRAVERPRVPRHHGATEPDRRPPLHDPIYEPLWATAASSTSPIAIHEGTTLNVVQSGYDRFEDFAYRHACSHPHEQQIACLSFTCAGILERHPHCGSYSSSRAAAGSRWWLERLDEHMEEWAHATTPRRSSRRSTSPGSASSPPSPTRRRCPRWCR